MPTKPLSERLDQLPLILAGPILRQVTADQVTVWVALRKPRTVQLSVYQSGSSVDLLTGTRATVTLGPALHLVAVTADKRTNTPLNPGTTYEYNLNFTRLGSDTVAEGDLFTPGVMANTSQQAQDYLSYHSVYPNAPLRPSFVYAPEELDRLRICQGSCRKPHGESVDGLVALDTMIRTSLRPGAADPRPHMAFFGGDQIYADDVADALLYLLIEASHLLLGKTEVMPAIHPMDQYEPSFRTWTCHNIKFTAHLPHSPEADKSHLLKLGEYYAMYLFAWSDVLWPAAEKAADGVAYEEFADFFKDIYHRDLHDRVFLSGHFLITLENMRQTYYEEVQWLKVFKKTLPNVRRALANVPVYMICDDHEITDDWYINKEWCAGVLDKNNLNGRRVIQNGLTAYTLFQAWGNTPECFLRAGQPGYDILQAAQNYYGGAEQDQKDKAASLEHLLGIPVWQNGQLLSYPPLNSRLRFHYSIRRQKYEIIVLDTRTMRDYPGKPQDPPELLSTLGFAEQLPPPPAQPGEAADVTLVLATTNVVSEWLTETAVEEMGKYSSVYGPDAGDAWTGQSQCFERLLARLADRAPDRGVSPRSARIVFLSGDIHYAFAIRMQLWAQRPYESPPDGKPVTAIFAELVASSFKNEALKTRGLQKAKIMTSPTRWCGWQEPPTRQQVRIGNAGDRIELRPDLWRFRSRPAMLKLVFLETPDSRVNLPPDWRYRIDMIRSTAQLSGALADIVDVLGTTSPAIWTAYKVVGHNAHNSQVQDLIGSYIIGHNNMGDVRFLWGDAGTPVQNDDDKWVLQRIWWSHKDDKEPQPYTTFRVSLRLHDEDYPRPAYQGERRE